MSPEQVSGKNPETVLENAGLTKEQLDLARQLAASVQGQCPTADMDRIARRCDELAEKLELLLNTVKPEGRIQKLGSHLLLAVEAVILHLIASGSYDLIKIHWAWICSLVMLEGDTTAQSEAADNYLRVTDKVRKDFKVENYGAMLESVDRGVFELFKNSLENDPVLAAAFDGIDNSTKKLILQQFERAFRRLLAGDGQL